MAAKNDFLKDLLDMMRENATRQDERMDKLDGKVDKNTETLNNVKGTVDSHDLMLADMERALKKIKPGTQIKKKNLDPWYRDPLILKILLYISLIALLIVAAVTGVNIGDHL